MTHRPLVDLSRRLHLAWLQRRRAMGDQGLGTLEMLILGAVLLTGAAAFALAWNGKFDNLLDTFNSSDG